MVEIDLAPGDTFNKKIRNAQLGQWNYILGQTRWAAAARVDVLLNLV